MTTWTVARLAEFCVTGSGGTPSRDKSARYYDGGTIPWVKSGELKEALIMDTSERITPAALIESSTKLVPSGAILLAMYGATIGRLGVLGVPAATNQAVCHIIPDPKAADTRYLFHALRSQLKSLVNRGAGGAQPNISQAIVKEIQIPLPPIEEQRRIADILEQADDLRAQRRAALVELESLTQSVFSEMLGDPVSNPHGWPKAVLGELLTFQQYGHRFYNQAYSSDGIRVVRITDLRESGELDFSKMPRQAVTLEERSKLVLQPGDLIFARSGSVGKVALIRPGDPECIAGAYFITMRFDHRVEPIYVRTVLASKSIRSIISKQSRQAVQQNFSGPALRRLPVPLPPLELQRRFARHLAETEMLKTTQRQSLAQLDELFNSLRHRAFRGEL